MPSDLAGMWFISKEKLEVGLGPGPEPVLGHWHLRFDDDRVHWQYSDVEVTPSYVLLSNGTIELTGMSIQARYFPEPDEILWDGRRYMLSQSDGPPREGQSSAPSVPAPIVEEPLQDDVRASLDRISVLVKSRDITKHVKEWNSLLASLPDAARLEAMCRILENSPEHPATAIKTAFVLFTVKLPVEAGSAYRFDHDALRPEDVKFLMQNCSKRQAYAELLVSCFGSRYVSQEFMKSCRELLTERIAGLAGEPTDRNEQAILEAMCLSAIGHGRETDPLLFKALEAYVNAALEDDTFAMAAQEWLDRRAAGKTPQQIASLNTADPIAALQSPRASVRGTAAERIAFAWQVKWLQGPLPQDAVTALVRMLKHPGPIFAAHSSWPSTRYNAALALNSRREDPGLPAVALPTLVEVIPNCDGSEFQAVVLAVEQLLHHASEAERQRTHERLQALLADDDLTEAKAKIIDGLLKSASLGSKQLTGDER